MSDFSDIKDIKEGDESLFRNEIESKCTEFFAIYNRPHTYKLDAIYTLS